MNIIIKILLAILFVHISGRVEWCYVIVDDWIFEHLLLNYRKMAKSLSEKFGTQIAYDLDYAIITIINIYIA